MKPACRVCVQGLKSVCGGATLGRAGHVALYDSVSVSVKWAKCCSLLPGTALRMEGDSTIGEEPASAGRLRICILGIVKSLQNIMSRTHCV